MDRSDASALADLQMHWDEAYAIGLDGHIWLARFHDSEDELRAHTSTELRELIRADYAYRQQALRVRAAAAGAMVTGDSADDSPPSRQGSGPGAPGPDDDDLDDDDYAAHFDGDEGAIGGHRHDAGSGRPADGRVTAPHSSYADLRGERMST